VIVTVTFWKQGEFRETKYSVSNLAKYCLMFSEIISTFK
jgi:hypothetical protein